LFQFVHFPSTSRLLLLQVVGYYFRKQHITIIEVAYYFHFVGTKYTIKYHELSLIMVSTAHTDMIILIFCVNIKTIANKTPPPSFVTCWITLREISYRNQTNILILSSSNFLQKYCNYPNPIKIASILYPAAGYPILILSMLT